jgi:CheY-like chemotaxis protein
MTAHILVVDDEPDVQALVLQKFRHKIRGGAITFLFARDGVEALASLKANAFACEVSGSWAKITSVLFEVLDVQGGELGATEGAAGGGPECPNASSLLQAWHPTCTSCL